MQSPNRIKHKSISMDRKFNRPVSALQIQRAFGSSKNENRYFNV